jgi:gp16 family phage-associated protein
MNYPKCCNILALCFNVSGLTSLSEKSICEPQMIPPYAPDKGKSGIEQPNLFLRDKGVSIRDWANEHGFSVALVYKVLNGQRKCLRGASHQIARELGMK